MLFTQICLYHSSGVNDCSSYFKFSTVRIGVDITFILVFGMNEELRDKIVIEL